MKILIYRLGSLGDTLLALPCFRAIRLKFPQASISLLTNLPVSGKAPHIEEVLGPIKVVDKVVEYPLKLRSFSKIYSLIFNLRRRKFDIAVHLAASRGRRASIRDFIFLKLVGVKEIVGIPWLAQDLVPQENREGIWEWEADRLARRLQSLLSINLEDATLWDLQLTAEEGLQAQGLLARQEFPNRRWIAASIGTKSDVNDWTDQNWTVLMRSLRKEHSEIGCVMIGSESDAERSERLLTEWAGPRLNLCGKISPRVSAAVLKEVELFVGHDSGPMHLAATVDVPCVAIFSARNYPGRWFPKGGNRNYLFYNRTECFGCGLNMCQDHGKKCILNITPREVSEAINEILNSTP